MRARRAVAWLICALSPWLARAVQAAEVAADAPSELVVTVYRAPDRQGSIDLDRLEGFALVSETRLVRLPAGESRLRFEGVADGIEAKSAIISGLPEGVLEKNRDARVLSPAALAAAAVGKSVEWVRTEPKTGTAWRVRGTILSDADGGVLLRTADGIEALRCSGLPERFDFEPAATASARPSLSARVRTATDVTARVTLSYLSRGFDWAADYSATLSPDGRSMNLGAWVTLANSNGQGFPSAQALFVAGRVSREPDGAQSVDRGGQILAHCWPRGSTSDAPPHVLQLADGPLTRSMKIPSVMMAAPLLHVIATASAHIEAEQLGDLKLYRIPERTTVAGRQAKQVRLFDRSAIPITTFYRANLGTDETQTLFPTRRVLRIFNDRANHLGLPLPSGRIAVFSGGEAGPVLLHESAMRDLAVKEKLEIELGVSSDVQVEAVHEGTLSRVQVSNTRPEPIRIELDVTLPEGAQLIRTDHPFDSKKGEPVFSLTVPAGGSAALQYRIRSQTQVP